jgi:FkbM family methyltransferase
MCIFAFHDYTLKNLLYLIIYQSTINAFLIKLIRPFKNLLPKKFWLAPSGEIEFRLKNGKLIAMKTNQTSFVTWNIEWFGYDKYEYVSIFEAIAPNINSFFDVGSNTGLYSLILAGSNANAKIWAFEPSPGPSRYLQANILKNECEVRIKAESIALADQDTELEFVSAYSKKFAYLKDATLGGSGHLSGARDETSSLKFKVTAMTLDNYVNENNIVNIDLIKLDTEETEHLIIKKGIETIKRFNPILICEVFSPQMADDLIKLLVPLDYSIYQSKKTYLESIEAVQFKSGEVADCFFVPKNKLHLISAFIK